MKDIAGLIVPVLMILFGIYALFTTLGSSGEEVTLMGTHALSRGLALMFGLIGLGGGAVVLFTSLSKRKHASS
jgi:hypothetical protein